MRSIPAGVITAKVLRRSDGQASRQASPRSASRSTTRVIPLLVRDVWAARSVIRSRRLGERASRSRTPNSAPARPNPATWPSSLPATPLNASANSPMEDRRGSSSGSGWVTLPSLRYLTGGILLEQSLLQQSLNTQPPTPGGPAMTNTDVTTAAPVVTREAPAAPRVVDGVTLPAAGTYVLDPFHTRIGFIARHLMVTKVRGNFAEFDGSITIAEDPARS